VRRVVGDLVEDTSASSCVSARLDPVEFTHARQLGMYSNAEIRTMVLNLLVGREAIVWAIGDAWPETGVRTPAIVLISLIRNGLLPALGTGAPTATHARRSAEGYAVYLKSLANSSDPTPNRP